MSKKILEDDIDFISPTTFRGSLLNNMLDFLDNFSKVDKNEKQTIGSLKYRGSLRNIGFYHDLSGVLLAVISLKIRVINKGSGTFEKIGIVSNFVMLDDYKSDILEILVLKCAEIVFKDSKVSRYYVFSDFSNIEKEDKDYKKVKYWSRSVNPDKVKNFRSLLQKKYRIQLNLNICSNVIHNRYIEKTDIYNIDDLIKLFSPFFRSKHSHQTEVFGAQQVSEYFLNKNPAIVTYLIDHTSLLSFHKYEKINRSTGKKITIASVELIIIDLPEVTDVSKLDNRNQKRDRIKKFIELIWRIEGIDQIIFQNIPSFEILFSGSASPFERMITEHCKTSEFSQDNEKIDFIY